MSAVVALPRIHPLSTEVANQIAAGEVIERPASVVKELLENSIDASASRIIIDLKKAGMDQVRIQDNGQGIHKDDLQLALAPHATSKLSQLSDLSQIVSLGFRGEALPSIASVSRFTLTSRMQDSDKAWSIDNALALKPAAHAPGTTVVVQDLFHATPARRKFLKSERTEFLHVQSLVRAMALSHFSVGLRFNHNTQTVMNLAPCADDPSRRIRDICGASFLDKSVLIDDERDGLHLWGWAGLNDQARSQSDRMYFFVNGRIVQDKNINHAIRLVYADRLDKGRFPSYVLYLQLDPARVDINVHPAKAEVRFAEARDVHDFIHAALNEAFSRPGQPASSGKERVTENRSPIDRVNEHSAAYRAARSMADLFSEPPVSASYLVLLDRQFLVAEQGDVHLLVDINKAEVLLTLHELLNAYRADGVPRRELLVPLTCELSNREIEALPGHAEHLAGWGTVIEQVAPTRVAVRSIPALLPFADTVSLVRDLIGQVQGGQREEQVAAALAAHAHDVHTDVTDDRVVKLLKRIQAFEAEMKAPALPWRRLDAAALATLLNQPS